jgi:ABC-type multidrug transport system ATPase subunit
VYSQANILLLDDVISAVDAQTTQHIVENCFQSPLMKDRTIIIASHAVEALAPLANHAVFLDDGRAIWTGSGKDLLASKHMEHLSTVRSKAEPSSAKAEQETLGKKVQDGPGPSGLEKEKDNALQSTGEQQSFELKERILRTPKQLIQEERRMKGGIDIHHWKALKRFNGNNLFWTVLLTLLLLATLSPVAERHALEWVSY